MFKTYGGNVQAVDQLDLTVESGELLVVMGPSGAGKTTMLRLIAGLESPSHGTIAAVDTLFNPLPPHRRNVAMMFQADTLLPHKTVGENLVLGAKLRKLSSNRWKPRSRQIAAMLEIEDLLDRYPSQLSGGQIRRVSLGCIIVAEPEIYLLDEPFGGLDTALRHRLTGQLRHIQRTMQLTMVCVMHDPRDATALADRIAVLSEGRLLQCERIDRLRRFPASRTVAEAVSPEPWNVIHGSVSKDRFVSTAGRSLTLRGLAGSTGDAYLLASPCDVKLVNESAGLVSGEISHRLFDSNSTAIICGQDGKLYWASGVSPESSRGRVGLSVDPSRCLVFDERGSRIYPLRNQSSN